jgi:immunoglobulin-binding protein 1
MERDEEITKRNKEEAERNKVDSDNEDYLDAKQMEARRWDDWKDDNEKGAGNKHK